MTSNQFNPKILKASFFLAWMLVYSSSFSEPLWAQVSVKGEQIAHQHLHFPDGQPNPDEVARGGTYERPPNFPDGRPDPDEIAGGASRWDFEGDGQPSSGTRNGGASRGRCPVSERPLTALVPKINLGLTTESHPTFWFYIPDEMANVSEAEFMLLDKENNPVIDEPIIVELSETPGLVSVSLPATAKSLEVGQEYHWFFALQCDPDRPSNNPTVDGWIQRVEPDPTLASELEETPDTEDYAIYANHGIWYDALTGLIQQYRTQAENPILQADWLALLEAVCLEEISATPE